VTVRAAALDRRRDSVPPSRERPVRILAATLGSHGDIHPFIAIGRAARARGDEYALVTHPFFGPEVEAAGLESIPIPGAPPYESIVRHPDLFHPIRGPGVVAAMIAEAVPPLVELLRSRIAERRPDVVLAHHIAFGARWVAEQAGIPCGIAALGPFAWYNPADPVPAMQQHPGRAAEVFARIAMPPLLPVFQLITDVWLNRLRRRTGFPPGRGVVWDDFRGGDVTLGMWSPSFRPPLPGDPPRARICGFPWYDGPVRRAPPADLESFLAEGPAPIAFTLGSAAVYTARDFYDVAAAACARLGRRGVLLIGRGERAPAALPAGVRAFEWAPHSWLMPRCAALVHHGGIGTTAQALRAGRPTIVVPHAHDQFNHAVRVERLGVGVGLPRSRVTLGSLAAALDRVLREPRFAQAASALAPRIAADDGGENAAEALAMVAGRTANLKQ